MIIRPYEASDAQATWEIFYDAVHIGAADHYSKAERNAWVETRIMRPNWRANRANETTLVAEKNSEILGFFSLKGAHVEMAFVRPDQRGTGVATKLYDALETIARNAGHTKLTAEASHLAKSFFFKRGWQVDRAKHIHARGVDVANFDMSKRL